MADEEKKESGGVKLFGDEPYVIDDRFIIDLDMEREELLLETREQLDMLPRIVKYKNELVEVEDEDEEE